MVTIPLFVLVAFGFALAVSLWLATLSVKFRDVEYAINFILMTLMYLSPVIYSVDIVPEPFRFFYALNPMTGVILGFRWALLGDGAPPSVLFYISVLIVVIAAISGAYIFRRTERTVVDIL